MFPNRKVKKGSLLIDSSTIDPAVSKEMAAAAEKMGAVFMDAPVSGGEFYIFDYNIVYIYNLLSNAEVHTLLPFSGMPS